MKVSRIISMLLLCGVMAILASCGKTATPSYEAAEADPAVAEEIDPADPDSDKLPYKIVDNVIFNENVPVVVDFYADWCGPCKKYAPTFHEVAEKYSEAACFISINTDEYPEVAKNYEIKNIPATVFIMPGGSVLGTEVGIIPQDKLETLVNQLISTSAGADMEI